MSCKLSAKQTVHMKMPRLIFSKEKKNRMLQILLGVLWLRGLITPAIFTRETTLVTSCLLSCTPNPFWKGVYSKKERICSNYLFSFKSRPLSRRARADPFLEGDKILILPPMSISLNKLLTLLIQSLRWVRDEVKLLWYPAIRPLWTVSRWHYRKKFYFCEFY